MTYPPGNPGYPPPPQAGQYGGPPQHFSRQPEQIPPAPMVPAGPSKLPTYLTAAVVGFGLLIFGFNFGPQFDGGEDLGRSVGAVLPVILALLAALLAGVGLLPKQKSFNAWVAILAVLALLLFVTEVIQAPSSSPAAWGLYSVLAFSVLQAGSALAALLLDAGVITAPVPRPKADPYYNAPQGQYYGHGGPQQQYPVQQAPPQRQDFGQQSGPQFGPQGGYYSQGAPQHSIDSGPPTPPTGFPAFGQPQHQSQPQQQPPQHQSQPPSSASSDATSVQYAVDPDAPSSSASADPTTNFQQQAPQQSGPTSA